jgi:multidrug efflux system outer membrane protein
MKSVILVLVVIASAAGDASPARGDAGGADRRPVTLAQVVEAAAKAPAAQVSGHDIAAAEATAAAASAWPNPSLRVGTSRLTARLIAGATLPLPIFGTIGAARRVAEAEAQVVRAEGELALRDLRHRVVVAWIQLARAQDDLAAQQVAARQARDLEGVARGRLDAGSGAEVDVTVAIAARARAEVTAAAAQRTEDAASGELAGLLGWDPTRPLRAEGAPVVGPAVGGSGPPGGQPGGEPADAIAALRGRLARHPERTAASRRVAAADASVAQASAQRWPGLALEGELDYDDVSMTEGRTAWDRTDAHVGVSLELPVFARTGDRARAAQATARAQRARLAAIEAELDGRLYAAYRRWQAAAEQLAALERVVLPAQERAAALSMQAYREGARDLSSALVAQRDLATARAELNDARATAALAFAELAVALGEDVHAS